MNDVAPALSLMAAPSGNSIVSLGPWWVIAAEPHVMLRLKRIFAGLAKDIRGEFRLRRSPEVDRDIEWILDRWDFAISDLDRKLLHGGAEWQRRHEREVAKIIAGDGSDRAFDIAVTPRDYQKVAASWWGAVKRGLLADDLGGGKQHPIDTKILTPTGYREIGALRVGDLVIGSSGLPIAVLGIYPQGVKPSYRVTWSDGASVEAGPDHLWTVRYRRGGRNVWQDVTVTTDQLRIGAAVTTAWPGGARTMRLGSCALYLPMLSAPVTFAPAGPLPIPAYALGTMIANAALSAGTAMLSIWDRDWPEIRASLTSSGVRIGTERTYGTVVHASILDMPARVRALGLDVLSGAKRIPPAYMLAPVEDRIALLHGLMDGDGSCSATRSRLTYHTSSPGLADDVCALVEQIGGVASVTSNDRGEKGIDYRVRVRLPPTIPPFRLRRKLDRYAPAVRLHPTRTFVGAEYVRDVESVCIAVDAPDRLYATEHAILTHNTISALTGLSAPGRLPALIVCQSHLTYQWREQILRCFPAARVHILTKNATYDVPDAMRREERREGKAPGAGWPDYTIASYSKLATWAEPCCKAGVRSVVYDEVQELRHNETQKYAGAVRIAASEAYILGMSATPVWNYGGAFVNVADILRPGFLGSRAEFFREWCGEGEERKKLILDPRAFGKMLRESGFMLKRTRSEMGRELPALTVAPHLIDTDGAQFAGQEHTLRALAAKVLERAEGAGAGFAKMKAAGELDIKLRKITGVAKAPYVADLVRMVVESGEKVVVGGWHREFWDILATKLHDYAPAFYTGHETPAQKAESRRRFVEGETPILCVSLASCAGLDGLQDVCATGIVGELAWTPKIIEQLMGRLHRDGQARPVTWLYCYTTWGSDPIVMDVCGVKESQSSPIVNPDAKVADVQVDPAHVRRLAEDFLRRVR